MTLIATGAVLLVISAVLCVQGITTSRVGPIMFAAGGVLVLVGLIK